ncbi:MAG: competence/damage-inducible protein A [Gemmatimonadetes bacterium]|nr:competence/damage-inducible protein A [Gemmatimonadota bacterium]
MKGASSGAPTVEIVTVGDELLLGETVDTNAAWLGRRLAEYGLVVVRRASVGDDRAEIQAAVGAAVAAADVVIVTGGLGPTPDDMTKEAVCARFGLALTMDESLLAGLRERFRRRGYGEMPETNRRQAEVPESARVLPNPVGTAPGLVLEPDGRAVILLPGVPRELRGLMEPQVRDYLRGRFRERLAPVHHRLLRTTGLAESALADRIAAAIPREVGPVALAFLPDLTGVDLRLTVRGVTDPAEATEHLDRVARLLTPVVGSYCYAEGDQDLSAVVGELLRARGMTLAAAESCTGGLIAKRITDIPGSSDYFMGGVVAYANEVKVTELGVDPSLIASAGAVSEEVARAMASAARRRFGADMAVAVTGIAGPGGGTRDKPVGTVWYAVATGESVTARHERFLGDREEIRIRAAQAALALLWLNLRERR